MPQLPSSPLPSRDYLSRRKLSTQYADWLHTSDGKNGKGLVMKKEAETPAGVIVPTDGSWKSTWDIYMLLLIIYSAVAVPFRVCFSADAEGILWLFEAVVMTFSFIADVYFSFFTAFFDNGEWVTDLKRIRRVYMGGWFWIDAPSSVPVELIELFAGGGNDSLALLRFLRLFRLLRLLKLLKLNAMFEVLEESFGASIKLIQLIILCFKLVFVSHIMGCFWFGVGVLSLSMQLERGVHEEEAETWYGRYGLNEHTTTAEMYVASMYWAMTTLTTIGYGDIIPTNDAERLYAVFAQLVSALVFGAIISNIGVLLAQLDRQASMVEEKLDSVKEYIEMRKLSKTLGDRLKKHFKFYYAQQPTFDEHSLLAECPPALRLEVTKYVLQGTLGRLKLFTDALDPEFQGEIFPFIKPISYQQGEVIYRKGEASRELLFLIEGEVNIMSNFDEGEVARRLTPEGEVYVSMQTEQDEEALTIPHMGCFGETVLIGTRREATHMAHTYCETLCIFRDDISTIFMKNPMSAQRMLLAVLTEFNRKERLRKLTSKLLVSWAIRGTENWAALQIQYSWSQFCKESLARPINIGEDDDDEDGAPGAPAARHSNRRSVRHSTTESTGSQSPSPTRGGSRGSMKLSDLLQGGSGGRRGSVKNASPDTRPIWQNDSRKTTSSRETSPNTQALMSQAIDTLGVASVISATEARLLNMVEEEFRQLRRAIVPT